MKAVLPVYLPKDLSLSEAQYEKGKNYLSWRDKSDSLVTTTFISSLLCLLSFMSKEIHSKECSAHSAIFPQLLYHWYLCGSYGGQHVDGEKRGCVTFQSYYCYTLRNPGSILEDKILISFQKTKICSQRRGWNAQGMF